MSSSAQETTCRSRTPDPGNGRLADFDAKPSEGSIEAANELLSTAVRCLGLPLNDGCAVHVIRAIPLDEWPTHEHQEVAKAIIACVEETGELSKSGFIDRCKLSPSEALAFGNYSESLDHERRATAIRRDYIERTARHSCKLALERKISIDELRQLLSDFQRNATTDQPAERSPVDTREWLIREPVPIEFVFQDMIARMALVLITGMGGLGKSGVLLVLIASGCIGRPLLPSFKPVSRLRVLWLCSEDDANEVWRRWVRVSNAYGLTEEEREVFAVNCRLFCRPGSPLMDCSGSVTLEYHWLRRQVESFQPDLIVLDPLSHFHMLDENANAEMAVFMSRLRDLSTPHGAAILAVHHVPKARQTDAESAAARGASSIRDGARAMFSLVPLNGDEMRDFGISNPRLFARLEHTKASWTPLSDRAVFLRNQDGVWFECDMAGQRDEARRDILGRMARRIGALLDKSGGDTYTRREIAKQPKGNWIREQMEREFGTNANRANYLDAIDHGVKIGSLFEEVIKQKGHPRVIVRPYADKRTAADSNNMSETPNQ